MRRAALALILLLAATTLAACASGDGLEVRAAFDDVADLVPRASVKIADVPVGTVSSIELTDDLRALVTMRLRGDIELPSRVRAELRKTAVLGERYIALIPDRDSGGVFESGTVIQDVRFVPELEELVGSGSELLAAVAADKLAAAIEAGAEGLDGRGPAFAGIIDDLATIVDGYERNSGDLVRLIDGFEQFLAKVGPQSELHGAAFAELAKATTVLAAEDQRLLDTLQQVRLLSAEGADIMRVHRERLDRGFQRWAAILAEIASHDASLDRLFTELYKHNYNTIRGVHDEHGQVLLDFIVCGINDTPGDPVRSCMNPPQGKPRPEPRPSQDFGEPDYTPRGGGSGQSPDEGAGA